MLYNCLEWYKWVLTNLYHDRQLYNTYSTVARVASGRPTNFTLEWIRELTLRYTTPDIHRRHRRHECDGGIMRFLAVSCAVCLWCVQRLLTHFRPLTGLRPDCNCGEIRMHAMGATSALKLELHDANTDTDFLARILADSPDTPTPRENPREDVSAVKCGLISSPPSPRGSSREYRRVVQLEWRYCKPFSDAALPN